MTAKTHTCSTPKGARRDLPGHLRKRAPGLLPIPLAALPRALHLLLLSVALLASSCERDPASSLDPAGHAPGSAFGSSSLLSVEEADSISRKELRAASTHRTVLIQLHGLPALWLDRWLEEGRFLPEQPPAPRSQVTSGGLARMARGARASGLVPTEPGVTAPNLATMLTGAGPISHGVLSDRYYRQGKRVSGFRERPVAESLVDLAPRLGLRTVIWAVSGTSCEEPPLALLRIVCYPTRRWLGRPRPELDLRLAPGSQPANLWLRAGRRAKGARSLRVQVRRDPRRPGRLVLLLPQGAILRGGGASLAPGDARDLLWLGGTAPDGTRAPRRLTRLLLRSFDGRAGRARFYVSPTAVSLARPASFLRALDRAGVIRPAMADERSFSAGLIDEKLFVRTGMAEVGAAVELARLLGRGDSFDLAIIYLGVVGSLARQLLTDPGRQELSRDDVVGFRQALEHGLREVDRRLGRILDGLDLRRTRVVLASDHGMLPVRWDVSLRAALSGVEPPVRVVTSGGAGFVHLARGVSAATVAARLSRLKVAGRLVFGQGRVVTAPLLSKLGLPDSAGDIFVQASPGFSLSHRRSKTLLTWPRALAADGFRSDLPQMRGAFLAAGPGVTAKRLGLLHMTQVAAAVAAALGVRPPRGASPAPDGLWTQTSR